MRNYFTRKRVQKIMKRERKWQCEHLALLRSSRRAMRVAAILFGAICGPTLTYRQSPFTDI